MVHIQVAVATVHQTVENPIFVNNLPLDTAVYSVIYDLNDFGNVDINDLVTFARNFGKKRPTKTSTVAVYASEGKLEEMPAVSRGNVNDVVITAYLDNMNRKLR